MTLARYIEMTEQIEYVLAAPMPPPAEMHQLRESLFALVYARLGEVGSYSDVERDEQARDFTLKMVDQRITAYPMHLREQIVPGLLSHIKDHAGRMRKE